jgi:threonine/homoserine/homoserine lactone efflux protein
MSIEYIITAFIVVLLPGTGVIYTISTGLFKGNRHALAAAIGCTLGIVPHMLASSLGLAAILHTSAVAFQFVKYAGVAYLLYLAYSMWKSEGGFELSGEQKEKGAAKIISQGLLINILNPKLSIFFLAFLPQFITPQATSPMMEMFVLASVFMLITLVVFVLYGMGAAWLRQHVVANPKLVSHLQKFFALSFVGLGAKLAMEDR